MRKDVVTIGAVCGVLAPAIWFIFYLVAWSQSPWYEFGGHYLSDLGVGEGAWAFNTGNVVAGVLAIPFALALWKILKPGWLPLLGGIFCAAGGVALVGVGIVTEHIDGHFEVSVAFFLSAALFELFLALPLIRNENTRIAGYVVTVLLIATIIAGGIIGFNPLSETIAVMEVLVWTLIVSVQVLTISLRDGLPPEDS